MRTLSWSWESCLSFSLLVSMALGDLFNWELRIWILSRDPLPLMFWMALLMICMSSFMLKILESLKESWENWVCSRTQVKMLFTGSKAVRDLSFLGDWNSSSEASSMAMIGPYLLTWEEELKKRGWNSVSSICRGFDEISWFYMWILLWMNRIHREHLLGALKFRTHSKNILHKLILSAARSWIDSEGLKIRSRESLQSVSSFPLFPPLFWSLFPFWVQSRCSPAVGSLYLGEISFWLCLMGA